MNNLVPCPSCHRHVRAVERSCPFCATALPDTLANAVIPGATQRLSRAAAFAFTATLSIAGCGDSTTPTPPADAQADTSTATDTSATTDTAPADVTQGDVSMTDVARPDASPADVITRPDASPSDVASDAPPPDDGSVGPLYGLPADASTDDVADGGGGVRYGAPPALEMV